MTSNTRKPCLAEDWFVSDGLEMIAGGSRPRYLSVFGNDDEAALREVYRQSRDIRVGKIMTGQFDSARATGDWAALEILQFIGHFAEDHIPRVKNQIDDQ